MPSLRRLSLALFAAAVAVTGALPHPGAAPAPAAAQEARPGPLSDPTIEAFIATIPAVRLWTDQHADAARAAAPELLKPSALGGNIFGEAVKLLRGSPAYDDLTLAVGRHGFEDPESWAGVANRVTKALGVLAIQRDDANNPLAQAEREIAENPNLSGEERMKLKGMLMALSLFATAPEADVTAVAPYSGDIIAALREPL